MNTDRTHKEQEVWDRFIKKLDRRYFAVSPAGVIVRCSAMTAKHIAREQLPFLEAGAVVSVSDGTGTIWCQRNTTTTHEQT